MRADPFRAGRSHRRSRRDRESARERRTRRNAKIAAELRHLPEARGLTNAQLALIVRHRRETPASVFQGWSPEHTLEPLVERGLLERLPGAEPRWRLTLDGERLAWRFLGAINAVKLDEEREAWAAEMEDRS